MSTRIRHYAIALLISGTLTFGTQPFRAESALNAPPATGLLSRQAIVFNPTANKVYAVDALHNAVTVIDVAAHASHSIPVGDHPVAIAMNQVSNRVYVANTGGGTVSVLDGKTDQTVATVDVGKSPFVLAANQVANKVYVSNTFSNWLTIIDGATLATSKVKAGSADAITLDENRNRAYLLGYESPNLAVFDDLRGSFEKLPAGETHLWGMALDENTATLYVTRIGSGDLVAIRPQSNAVQPFKTGALPCAVAVNQKTRTVYVANCGDDTVTVIDEKQSAASKTLRVGSHPQAIAVDEKNNLVYVANTHGDSVTVIDGLSNQVKATSPAGKNPYAIAVDPGSRTAYVANLGEPAYHQIDVSR